MKCTLRSLTLALYLFVSIFQLCAQNVQPSTQPAFFIASKNGSSGLQAYHYFKGWRDLAFGSVNREWNSGFSWNATAYGFFGGSDNTATGTQALSHNTTGSYNTADGYWTLTNNTTGNYNTGVGYDALLQNTTGLGNTGLGSYALITNFTGSYLTAIGLYALQHDTSESYSVAVGYSALNQSNSATGYNTAIGPMAMYSNTSGFYNSAIGDLSMYSNTTGSYNQASGTGALYGNTSGTENVGVGYLALWTNSTGNSNTALGYFANVSSGSFSNAMALGANAQVTASNKVVVGSSAVTSIGGYVGWSNFSDGRYKRNIQQNVPGLAFINKLSPVTYTLDISGIESKLHESQNSIPEKSLGTSVNSLNDPVVKQSMQEKSSISYSGFVAQDVEKAADSLGYNFSGIDKPKDANQSFYGLRYGDFVVPLVKAVQELSSSSDKKDSVINSMQQKVDSLQTQINELRSMILSKNQTAGSGVPGASLDQNVPNPASNSTTIAYGLPQGNTTAQMQITDMSGKILQIISLSGVGRNTITVDTSSFASGTYSYSLLVNGQLAGTRRMVSVR